eukprot:1972071-Amphidinium_carterae.1
MAILYVPIHVPNVSQVLHRTKDLNMEHDSLHAETYTFSDQLRLCTCEKEEPGEEPAQAHREHVAARGSRIVVSGDFWHISSFERATGRGSSNGFEAVCKLHRNGGEATGKCKKSLALGHELSEAEALLRLKRWILQGAENTLESSDMDRSTHSQLDARYSCSIGPAGAVLENRLTDVHTRLVEAGLYP